MQLPVLIFALLMAVAQDEQTQTKSPPAGPAEEVVVTAARVEQPVSEAVSLVTVVPSEQIANSPFLELDDLLRSVPGFSLFRRSSSLVAHPTTQGVSLRGIGPSGAGRSLVLLDGIPMNDPVGGWVYWNRLPATALDRVEVVHGATSQLYGNSALGGTIQLVSRPPVGRSLSLRGQAGNAGIADLDLAVTDQKGNWRYLLSGRLFDSSGYDLVRKEARGHVDVPAGSAFQTFFGRAYYKSFHAGLNLFRESRNNGTRLQTNRSRLALFDVGIEREHWDGRLYAQSELFASNFSRVSADRSSEFLTSRQEIPSRAFGAAWTWRPASLFVVGLDWRGAGWDRYHQNLAGLFGQALLPVTPSLDFLIGARLDVWQNEKTQTSVNPRAGVVWRLHDWVTVRTSAYRGFRSPTLNELYRPFRVGNVETLANPRLGEEYLWGGEAGTDFHPNRRVLVRVNAFWNSLQNPVANVTLSTTPTQVLRQRMNLGGIAAAGLEHELILDYEVYAFRAGYLYSAAAVKGSSLKVPQAPAHQAVLAFEYRRGVTATVQSRWIGRQFEDDLNSLVLPGYFVVDGLISRAAAPNLRLFVAVENLFDRKYAVGRTPVEQVGSPRLVHGGIAFDIGAR
ncbi:MAG: TonB-dependent receptor plug domain-containing protein [Acidobacteriota bacterium]